MKKILNSNSLKIVAIVAMLLDHIAMGFLVFSSVFYFVFRFIGRVCAPIMFYSLAKGYYFTKDKFKYGMRLFVFALISQIPYSLFVSDMVFDYKNYNVIFTLFFGFLSLVIFDKVKDKLIKYSLIVLCLVLSYFCDYRIIGVIFVLLFYILINNNYKYLGYAILSFLYLVVNVFIYRNVLSFMIGLGLFMVIPLIYLDNGSRGKYNLKYLFYVFYPLHMLVLFVFKIVL